MVFRNALFGTYVAEHTQLLLVFSTHAFFIPACPVETTKFFVRSDQVKHLARGMTRLLRLWPNTDGQTLSVRSRTHHETKSMAVMASPQPLSGMNAGRDQHRQRMSLTPGRCLISKRPMAIVTTTKKRSKSRMKCIASGAGCPMEDGNNLYVLWRAF